MTILGPGDLGWCGPCPLACVVVHDSMTLSCEELLDFLEDAMVTPGTNGVVTASSPDGTTTVEIDGHHIGEVSEKSIRSAAACCFVKRPRV